MGSLSYVIIQEPVNTQPHNMRSEMCHLSNHMNYMRSHRHTLKPYVTHMWGEASLICIIWDIMYVLQAVWICVALIMQTVTDIWKGVGQVGTMGSDREQSQQDGGSRWMKVDSWIVMDRHGCPSGVGWQGFGLVGTRNECFGKRNRGRDPSWSW
jgi:hypothetical protein